MINARSYNMMEVYNCDFLNVRKGPSTRYAIISKVIPGRILEVVSKKGNWARVRFNGGYAWVSLLYLKAVKNTTHTGQLRVYKVLRAINLRDNADWNANIIRVAYKNELLDVEAIVGDWAKVITNGRTLYAPITNSKVVYLQDTGVVKPGTGGEEEEPAPPLVEEKEPIRPVIQYKNEFWIDIVNPDMPDFRFNTSELNIHMIEKPTEEITIDRKSVV